MNWDDLRFVLAVGRHGTLSAAGRSLAVNHSTVFRRLAQIERQIGTRLFERHPDGLRPTPVGEEAVALGERLEGQIDDLERRLAGSDHRLSGTIRITTTDTLLSGALSGPLAAFRASHPEIVLEIIIENRFLSLSKRDADVAIRPSKPMSETLVGRRVCPIATAIYAAAGYLEKTPVDGPLSEHCWIAPDDSLGHLASARWLKKTLAAGRTSVRVNTVQGMLVAAEAGLGLAPLPCFLGDQAISLRRVHPPIDELASELWLLTHRDFRHVARIRAFLDMTSRSLRQMTDKFSGCAPVPKPASSG